MKKKTFKFTLILLTLILTVFLAFGCGNSDDSSKSDIPKIGISWCEDIDADEHSEDLQVYINAVEQAGGDPVLLPLIEDEDQADEVLDTIDGLVMTGGEDIDPSYYGEEPDSKLETVNAERDKSDNYLLKAALDEDFPILAICRGVQFLNVVCGGTLYQDIPTQYDTDILHRSTDQVDFVYHDIDIVKGSKLADIMGAGTLNVNSWHHQGIKKLGDGLTVVATAKDGMIEAVEKDDATFVLGLQFHPEWHIDDGDTEFLPIFQTLVEYASK
jgi:putative glutamine amidotransferase